MRRRRCASCEPHAAHGAARWHWLHAESCALHPGQEWEESHAKDTLETVARKLHPAGKTETERAGSQINASFSKGFDGWHRQPKVGPMTEAVQWVDSHVDDELEDSDV